MEITCSYAVKGKSFHTEGTAIAKLYSRRTLNILSTSVKVAVAELEHERGKRRKEEVI